jgi:hypothetical protein
MTSLPGAGLVAQDDTDALRFSQTTFYGDSRFMAMGGAFGALGANLSCMHFNPAGIAVYRNGEFVFTPGVRIQTAATAHYDSSNSDFSTKLNVSNLAFASAWEQRNPYPANNKLYENWNQRHAFGISYNRLADFNFSTSISGSPDNSSIINDFVNVAQGYYPSNLTPTYEWLAYQTYLINPESSSDTSHYWGMMLPNTPIQQDKKINTSGRMGELAFCFAHAFNDKFYAGATLGVPMLRFTRSSEYTEVDYKKSIWPFHSLKYEEQLVTTGRGYNLKAGVIYRLTGSLRIGAYAHTPTVLKLTDNYEYILTAVYDTAITTAGTTYKASSDGYFNYRLYTPARAGASAAYIYKRLLAVNADAEFVSYGAARFKDDNDYLKPVNRTIQKKYKGATNIRAGAELNLEPVIIRAGYALYGSPFGSLTGKFARSSYSAGIGFKRKSNTYIDIGAIYTTWTEDYYLYDPALVRNSTIKNSVLYLTFTLGIKFN